MNEKEKFGILHFESGRESLMNMLNLEIYNSAYVHLDERWKYEKVCNSFTRLYYVRAGKGFLRSNGSETQMLGGNVYIIPAGCEFSYGCESLEKLFFHVSIIATEKYDLLSGIKNICSIPFSDEDFCKLLKYHSSNNYIDALKMKTILFQTIADFAEKCGLCEIEVKQYSELVEKCICYIQKNLHINLSVESLAKEMFVSESKIRKAFKEETGKSLGKYIEGLVFFRAKQLLAKRDISIGEISRSLGFCDQFHFSRRFKKTYDQSPSEFRKNIVIL